MNCPLCKKHLLEIGPEPYDYICQTRVNFRGSTISHYEDRNEGIHWTIPPYQIVTKNNKSSVWVLKEVDGFTVWKIIFEGEIIHPDTPEKLQKRIKNLIILS